MNLADYLRRFAVLPVSARATRIWARLLHIGPAGLVSSLQLADLEKILVVRLDDLGDLVLTSPLLRELKRNAPRARITLLVRPDLADLARGLPGADEVLCLDPAGAGSGPRAYRRFARCLQFARAELRPRQFDLAIAPRRDVDYHGAAMLMYFSGAARRMASAESASIGKAFWNRGADRLVTDPVPAKPAMHEIDYQLSFLRSLGGKPADDRPALVLAPGDLNKAKALLGSISTGDSLLAIAPGAGHPARQWPVKSFIETSLALQKGREVTIVIVGGRGDRDAGARLRKAIPDSVDLTGQLSIPETAAVLSLCRAALCNDSGPAHLSAAVGTPVVVLSCHPAGGDADHANAPERFRPRGSRVVVLQPDQPRSPCLRFCAAAEAHCICGIPPERATQAMEALLEDSLRTGVTPTNIPTLNAAN